eukprot:1059691-Amphidinium_carterae.1
MQPCWDCNPLLSASAWSYGRGSTTRPVFHAAIPFFTNIAQWGQRIFLSNCLCWSAGAPARKPGVPTPNLCSSDSGDPARKPGAPTCTFCPADSRVPARNFKARDPLS